MCFFLFADAQKFKEAFEQAQEFVRTHAEKEDKEADTVAEKLGEMSVKEGETKEDGDQSEAKTEDKAEEKSEEAEKSAAAEEEKKSEDKEAEKESEEKKGGEETAEASS